MADMNGSILDSIKKNLGIVPEYTAFDDQIILDINAAFSTLNQLGFGPDEGFEITGIDEFWSDIIEEPRFNFVKSYVCMKVRVMFDPPTSSYALDALNKQIAEYEWRIKAEIETGGSE